MKSAALLIALIACGDNLPGPTTRSGARIQLVAQEFADGTRHLDPTLYDRARDEPCVPTRWSDGFHYCAPITTAQTVFADAGCTTELGRVVGDPPAYLVHPFWVVDRFYPSRLYARGDEVAAPAETYVLRDGRCDGPTPVAPGERFFTLGAELAVTSLASIARDVVDDAIVVESSRDGMQRPVAIYDPALAIECVLDRLDDTTARCVPPVAPTAVYFHDDACSAPELSVPARDPVPEFATVYDAGRDCTTYFEVATQVGSTPLYRDVGGTCTMFFAPSDEHQFLLGAPLALQALTRARLDDGGPRFERIAVGPLEDPALYDRELGVECVPRALAGELRCLPSAAAVTPVFDDALCTQPSLVAEVPRARCDVPLPPARFALHDGAYHEVLAPAPTVYELTTGDRCVAYTPDANVALHQLGPAVPLDRFGAAMLVPVP
ncbi:MAG TPA: hypothetical protein VFQ53_17710 [Kofleriaceae bacterium]|nr:hypothetical protein [Kofleriaceae bacterium]